MVTKKQLANRLYISISKIEQIGSKQLFIVDFGKYKLLYSYITIIGYSLDGENYIITSRKYSLTTTRHKKYVKHILIDGDIFQSKLNQLTRVKS